MTRLVARHTALGLAAALAVACGAETPQSPTASSPVPPAAVAPIYVVLFTHIEDNTPAGPLMAPATRGAYLTVRAALIDLAERARRSRVPWSLQPDWKFLEAALLFEDAQATASTGGRNVLSHLREALGVALDPHSHENGGYNYTDVAHLLEQLGVGGSTVIGGHIWDPALPQFQQWDRFRAPVSGQRYPSARWRGDILMGSGTPNHVNDPIISGVWRPRDRLDYWTDDPAGNITAVGAYRADLAGISELVALARSGQVPAACMLTASLHARPADFLGPAGGSAIENSLVRPLAQLRDSGAIELTDFTALVDTWRQRFGARACTSDGRTVTLR